MRVAQSSAVRPAVFLDRDGTLNVDTGYVSDASRVALIEGAAQGAKALSDAGFVLIVASNQSGIARGMMTQAQADAVDERLLQMLRDWGVTIEAVYRCPHHPQGLVAPFNRECDCRKPKPGMLVRAASELDLDLHSSWAVGDRARDVVAGVAAGCRTVLLEPSGSPRADDLEEIPGQAYRAQDLVAAAQLILKKR